MKHLKLTVLCASAALLVGTSISSMAYSHKTTAKHTDLVKVHVVKNGVKHPVYMPRKTVHRLKLHKGSKSVRIKKVK
jgi:hypothetical protein